MTDAEKDLSPEERLLKVIQQDGPGSEKEAETVVGPPPSRPPAKSVSPVSEAPRAEDLKPAGNAAAAVEPAAQTEAAPPKLRIAAPAPGTGEPSAGTEGPKAPAKAKKRAARPAAPRPAPHKRKQTSELGVSTVNKCLVVLVVVMLVFTALEILANVQTSDHARADTPAIATRPVSRPEAEEPRAPVVPSIDALVQSFEGRSLFGLPTAVDTGPQPTGPMSGPDPRKSLSLIGLSVTKSAAGEEREAIVVDTEDNKMHFLKVGDALVVGNRELKLERIHSDRIDFRDGKYKIEIISTRGAQ